MAEKKAKEENHKFRSLQDSQLVKSDKDFIATLEIAEKALTENKTDKELLIKEKSTYKVGIYARISKDNGCTEKSRAREKRFIPSYIYS